MKERGEEGRRQREGKEKEESEKGRLKGRWVMDIRKGKGWEKVKGGKGKGKGQRKGKRSKGGK